MYEGIALIQEKQAVVLDLGTDYTKFGFTGEAAPRCIIRSKFWCPAERRLKSVHDYRTPEELYDNLVNMLHLLYFRHVLVNPKERKVIVVESLLTPTLFRETLAKVLFLHYEVCSVVWADSARLCSLVVATPVLLVVEIGAVDVEITPVIHGVAVLRAVQSQPLGAHAIHDELSRLLDLDNQEQLHLTDDQIEDIKVKTCFVSPSDRAAQWASQGNVSPARDVRYPVAGRAAILVSGHTREMATETLFARDNELASLPDLVLQAIQQCPIDSRLALAENILLCGGGAALPGLRARLADELHRLVLLPPYSTRLFIREFKFHTAPAQDNIVAWVGGAVCGAVAGAGTGTDGAMQREVYLRGRSLRDWPSLLYNERPAH